MNANQEQVASEPKYVPLEGEDKVETFTRKTFRRACDVCERPATYRITFLLNNARRNPKSAAYGRADCSWCSDDDAFACEEHKNQVEKRAPVWHEYCATFDAAKNYPHMLLYTSIISRTSSPWFRAMEAVLAFAQEGGLGSLQGWDAVEQQVRNAMNK